MEDFWGEPIHTYASEEAEEDGILVDISKAHPGWDKGMFNYVTRNLLGKGYLNDEKVNLPNLTDLLNQALQIAKTQSKNFTKPDSFYSGVIELPDGEKQQIFIQQNETGKYTIMLPEDY